MIYEFAATQDLHGYDKPWAPGAGDNLLDPDSFSSGLVSVTVGSSIDDVTSTPRYMYSEAIDCTEGAFCKLRSIDINVVNWAVIALYDADDLLVTRNVYNITDSRWYSVTVPASTYSKVLIQYGAPANEIPTVDAVEAIVSKGSSEVDYSPYANVCPPEGFNIWDPTTQEYIQVYAGYVNANTRELYLRPVYKEYAGEELVGPWMSSLDPYSEDTTPTEGAFVIDFGGELTSLEITPFMLQTLLDSLGIRQHFTDGAGLLNKLMDQAQGRVRSEEELIHLSRPLKVIAIGDQLPVGITFKPISKDVLPGLPGKFIR